MSDPVPAQTVARRSGVFLAAAVLLLVVVVLLALARFVPGPPGLRVTVIETGKVGTSSANLPQSSPPPDRAAE